MTHPLAFCAALCAALLFTPRARAQDLYVGSNSSGVTTDFTSGTNAYGGTFVGYEPGANSNTLNVLNTNTLLTNTGDLTVGRSGSSNSMVISNGGKVANQGGYIGNFAASSNNSVLVTGTDSLWTNSRGLNVGRFGSSNSLVISNGGKVANGTSWNGYVGTYSSNNTVLVTGTDSLWTSSGGDLFFGLDGSGNSLVISNGGTVADRNGIIGNSVTSSNNSALVTGTSSLWTNSGELRVGNEGSSNSLVISNGGTVANADGYIGNNTAASNNSVLVTGTSSLWTNGNALYVGAVGSGNSLVITNGGTVANSFGYIGFTTDSPNSSVLVTDGGTWTNRNDLYVGFDGSTNSMVITNGGRVANVDGYIGFTTAASNNSVLVTGSSSVWTNSGNLNVGNDGSSNSMVISNGGTVANTDSSIGDWTTSSNNRVLVTGSNSEWTSTGNLYVGFRGSSNRLVISNGGLATVGTSAYLGMSNTASNNLVLVTGTNDVGTASLLSITRDLYVGREGSSNSLVISNGGKVASFLYGYIGESTSSSNNSVLVTGTDSLWTNSGDLIVGYEGGGNSLVISNGGTVAVDSTSGIGVIALSSNNAVLVTGTNSLWTNSSDLIVGNEGSGNSLVISNGGEVFVGTNLVISAQAGASNNSVSISGGSLTVTNGQIDIGRAASGTLNVTGGTVTVQALLATNGANSVITFNGGTIISEGTTVDNGVDFKIGDTGSGANFIANGGTNNFANGMVVGFSGSSNSMVITNGATVASAFGRLGENGVSSNNTVLVAGAGSVWTNSGDLEVGYEGSANRLVVSNGGIVANTAGYIGYDGGSDNRGLVTGANSLWTNSGTLIVGNAGSGHGLGVVDGGTVAASNIIIASGPLSSGTLNIGRFGTNDLGGTIITPTIAFGDGTGAINFNQRDAVTIASAISGLGTINQLGAGTTTLSRSNSYSGTTVISNGTLRTDNASALGTSAVQLEAGSLAPVGTLSIESLTWSGGTIASTLGTSTSFIGIATSFTLNPGGGTFAFTAGGGFAGNTEYTILRATNMPSFSTNNFRGNQLFGLDPTFTINGTNLLVSFQGATSGPLLQNSPNVYTPLDANFQVSNNVTTGKTNESNTVAALTFAGGSTLTVYNTLNVTNGNFTVNSGLATVTNGTLATPGDFNKLGAGTLALLGAAQVGSNAVIDAGTLIVEGTFASVGSLTVGSTNSGIAMVISNRGTVANTDGYIGFASSASSNSVLVTGANSLWTNSSQIFVGVAGSGNRLVISNAGQVATSAGFIGTGPGSSSNSVLVTGTSSTLTSSGRLDVGSGGSGNTMTIADGGSVSGAEGYLGAVADSSNNTVLITGAGSIWTNSGELAVGLRGTGNTLTLADGGTAAASNIVIAQNAGSSGTLNIGRFGTNDTGGTIVSPTIAFGAGTGAINFNHRDAVTIASAISGLGTINQFGAGTTTLSGANTYSGTTVISSGTLRTANASALGTSTVQLNAGSLAPVGTLNIESLTWSGGTIASTLGTSTSFIGIATDFTLGASGGEFAFTADGGFAGNTEYTILGWTNMSSFALTNFSGNALLGLTPIFTINDTNLLVSFQGSSGGSIIQNGAPTYTLTNSDFFVSNNVTTWNTNQNNTVNSLTFAPGSSLQVYNRLQVTSGNFTVGTGTATVQGGELFVPGPFTKLGDGLLNVIGTVTVSNAPATVSAGGLLVNGEFTANSLTVLRNALLGGAGTIFGNVFNNGTVSPGNSPGTLSIGGNFTQTAAGTFLLEAASLSNFDRLNATGAATVDGTLQAVGFGGHNLSPGDRYQFLTADGGISGTFDTITVPAGLRGRFLISGVNNSLGTLLIAPSTYTSMAVTPNQFNAAAALDNFIGAGGDRGTVSAALDTLTASQYPAAFEQVMPSQYASLPSMAFNVANALNSAMFQRLWVIRVNGKGFNASGVDLAPMQAEMGGTDDMGVFAINPAKETKWSSFVDGNGVFANASSTGSVQNYRSQGGGVSTGAAYSWTDAFATGVYVGYQGLQAEYDNGRTIDNAVRFGVFGTYDVGDFYFNALVGGAYHGYTVNRNINFGGLNRTATGRPGAGEFDLALGTGYDFDIGNFSWGPFTTLQYTYVGVQGFTETGAGALNLDVDPYNSSSLLYTLGAQAAYNWKVSDKVVVTPLAFAGWQHEFLQNGYGINSTFATGGPAAPFNYNTSSPARDNFYGGAGVTVGIGERWQATFIYSASAANADNSSQNIYFSIGAKF